MSEEHICPECGNEFEAANALGAHKTFAHSEEWHRPWKDKERMQELYHEKGMSQGEIAEKFDTDQGTVKDWMQRLEIETDKPRNDPERPPNHEFTKRGECVGTEYEYVTSTVDYEKHAVAIHRLLAVATGDLPVSEFGNFDIVVHHRSGHGLDNRPNNIEVMKRGDHQTMHLEERYG
jgi:hypothetical protein